MELNLTSNIEPFCSERNSRDLVRSTEDAHNYYHNKIGIYGWRKRCIYAFILTLLIMVILNLALSLWVLKVLEFSIGGMGHLKVLSTGLKLNGNAFIMDRLIASHIKSRHSQAIILRSNSTYTFSVRNQSGSIENLITLNKNKFASLSKNFKIKASNGKTLLSTNGREIFVNSESVKISGNDGITFAGSTRTPVVTAESANELKLASTTRILHITAGRGVYVETRKNQVEVVSGENISLMSTKGSINLQGEGIRMPHLPLPRDLFPSHEDFKFFQLCACANGKLFLVLPDTICSTGNMDEICQ